MDDIMNGFVEMDNLPEGPTILLNILWFENREMTLEELTEQINRLFSRDYSREEVRQFVRLLVRADYVEMRRHGFKTCYVALGSDYEL